MDCWKPERVGVGGERRRRGRRRVMIAATARLHSGCIRVIVRDASSSGLLLEVDPPPATGSYVEVIHGEHSVVARVMWCGGKFAGVTFRDRIDVDQWVKGVGGSQAAAAEMRAIEPPLRAFRTQGLEARHKGKWLQYLTLVIGACAAAGVGAVAVYELLSGVAEQVLKALS